VAAGSVDESTSAGGRKRASKRNGNLERRFFL
jgi:uncharacterized protein Veg